MIDVEKLHRGRGGGEVGDGRSSTEREKASSETKPKLSSLERVRWMFSDAGPSN